MRRYHRRYHGACGATILVALVHDAMPGNCSSQTLLTDLAVPEQQCVDTAKTKVMQRLDDANILLSRRVVGGR